MSGLLADFTRCYSGDLPSFIGRVVSGGVWPLLCAGPGPCLFCARVGPFRGPALTARGRHAQRLVCPTWARARRPTLGHETRLTRLGTRPCQRRAAIAPGAYRKRCWANTCSARALRAPVLGPRRACCAVSRQRLDPWRSNGLAQPYALGAMRRVTNAACTGLRGVRCPRAKRGRRHCVPLQALASAVLASSSVAAVSRQGLAPRLLASLCCSPVAPPRRRCPPPPTPRGLGRRARRPCRRAMIRGDSSDVFESA